MHDPENTEDTDDYGAPWSNSDPQDVDPDDEDADDEDTDSPDTEENVAEGDEEDEDEVSLTNDLHIKTLNLSAESIVKRMKQGIFIIPRNQRPFVWDGKQQSRLIESMLMGLPLPTAYLHQQANGKIAICDGQQRITTIVRFFEGRFSLKLGSDEDPVEYELPNGDIINLAGKKFKDLPPVFQQKLEDAQFPLYIIPANTPPEILLEIFDRVNSGTPLTPQQLRQSMYDGEAIPFLKEAAEYMGEKVVRWTKTNIRKSRDTEVVNRWVYYTLAGYQGDLKYKAALCEGLNLLNGLDDKQRAKLMTKFKTAIDNAVVIFGDYAFRKYDPANLPKRRPTLNVALFDCVAYVLGKTSKAKVAKAAPRLKEAFETLLQDEEFDKAISRTTSSPTHVTTRFVTCEEWAKIA